MDGHHPNNIDPRPKRRRDKNNPYELFTVGIHTETPHYYMRFRDSLSVEHCMEIDRELFMAFDRFELDDLSYFNEVDNHYEQSELTEASLNARAITQPEGVEEKVLRYIQNEALYRAIARLPELQRRRVVLYYFGEFTYEQIAGMENCTKVAVKHSVDKALAALKKFLE